MRCLVPVLLTLAPLLAACGNAPEQTSDVASGPPEQVNAEAEPSGGEEGAEEIALPDFERPSAAELSPSAVHGTWAADEAACTAEGGGTVTISSDRYESSADSCEISELVSGGDGFTASLSCERGTASETELLKLLPENDRLTLSWVARDDAGRELVRCE